MLIDADRFGASLESLLGDIAADAEKEIRPAVRKAARKARSEITAGAKTKFKQHDGRYAAGWSMRTKRIPDGYAAEVGNRDVPGLAHLLEKGHAKVGGGRVEGRPHIAPAADDAFELFQDEIRKAVEGL